MMKMSLVIIVSVVSLVPLSGKTQQSNDIIFDYPSEPVSMLGHAPSGYISNDIKLVGRDDDLPYLVISNGIDLVAQDNMVIDISNPSYPLWLSGPSERNFNMALGDIDLDGRLDMASSISRGRYGQQYEGGASVTYNFLSFAAPKNNKSNISPTWKTSDQYNGYGITLADIDADGDLDLITGSVVYSIEGQPAPKGQGYSRIYLNESGALNTKPVWTSAEVLNANDIIARDINQDGWIDLVFAGDNVSVFYGSQPDDNKVPFKQSPDWQTNYEGKYIRDVDAGLFNGFETLSIAASIGCDYAVDSHITPCKDAGFAIFQPEKSTKPVWVSDTNFIPSGVTLADLNTDGHLDLAGVNWFVPSRLNQGDMKLHSNLYMFKGLDKGWLDKKPSYTSKLSKGMHNILEDVAIGNFHIAPDFTKNVCTQSFSVNDDWSIFTLQHQLIEKIISVRVNDKPITPTTKVSLSEPKNRHTWLTTVGTNWITISPAVKKGDHVEVKYTTPLYQDIVITNSNPGSYPIFKFKTGSQSNFCDN
ncbi:FG-GAP repeat domain-containing protein [Pseudoalteromonas luteoviolacea]|uniref:ASPIC/UnbV domain-containing protein n=1 Tax=Pseudoalteromonas luteoviolacea S4054 TaxID=1129367 RepID=A0A0F6AEX4_9GAMM|nr:VCBS repeat-containing protein [Pseudoalteromonas luteoviolacea]AOT08392.1 hypothetical protein S4054249_11285 [Pseudoalteromonas luteoviolacea]AOT13308.1 hypothetical protein S40542_11260 [Pseudoalteromonas luteoviolacea]AOT18221.1 hypothetical protein S4054_11260 [Pseudoalteromonas luteoviolacea]KKE84341.1 hypothetical protein N479_10610 [Pseudoalteromonas luteoviolacea S4054]KZN76054.1 hypothetical protein N481_06805 [Pseudoalteromonas luteoviolacea S4047-1]